MPAALRPHARTVLTVLTLIGLGALAAPGAIQPARAAVTEPSCAAAEPWALALDPKDRWYLNPAQKRFWLPAGFQGAAFEALFGAPVGEWTLEDVQAIRPVLQACAQAARKAKKIEAQKAFNAARGFVSGNLKNYLVQRARAEAKLDQTLDALLELPDTPALLQTLALLRGLEAGNKGALRETQRRIARLGGAEAKAARPVLTAAHRQTPAAFAADTLPRLDERYAALRALYLEQAEDRIAEHGDGAAGLADIDAALAAARETLGAGLAPADYARLEDAAEGARAALRRDILEAATARLDALAAAPASIEEAAAIVAGAAPSLDAAGRDSLRAHGRARQGAIAGAVLAQAEDALAGFPATLAGIDELDRHVADALGTVAGHLDPGRLDAFRGRADARRADMAGAALPEFRALLAGLDSDAAGLEALEAAAARAAAWDGLDDDLRAAYRDAAAGRRAEMAAAMAAAAEQREAERRRRVVAATKARLDALGPRFRSLEAIPAEVEAARGKGLDAASMAEVEAHAAARGRAIADEILAQAEAKLGEAPETFEGLGQLIALVEVVIEETRAAASPAALAAFEARATAASSALGRRMLDGFAAELADLGEDSDGLEQARQAAEWAEGWRHVEADVRADYVAAAQARRDAIAAKLAAAEAERRRRVLAAGGDPELVGHTFADESGASTLEFADEKRVIFAVLGMRFGGTYKVVKDDIFVDGPNGSIVFARDGDTLTGMGLSLERVEK